MNYSPKIEDFEVTSIAFSNSSNNIWSLSASGDFCRLMIIFCKQFDQKIQRDQDPSYLTLKYFFFKIIL